MEKAQEGDKRCQGITPHGQCPYIPVDNQNHCRIHGGQSRALHLQRRDSIYQLKKTEFLKKAQNRIQKFMNDPTRHSLESEIGISRLLIENILQQTPEDEVLLRVGEITSIQARIESMIKTSLSIEKELGMLISSAEVDEKIGKILSLLIDELESYENHLNDSISQMRTKLSELDLSPQVQNEILDCIPAPQAVLENLADTWEDNVQN